MSDILGFLSSNCFIHLKNCFLRSNCFTFLLKSYFLHLIEPTISFYRTNKIASTQIFHACDTFSFWMVLDLYFLQISFSIPKCFMNLADWFLLSLIAPFVSYVFILLRSVYVKHLAYFFSASILLNLPAVSVVLKFDCPKCIILTIDCIKCFALVLNCYMHLPNYYSIFNCWWIYASYKFFLQILEWL